MQYLKWCRQKWCRRHFQLPSPRRLILLYLLPINLLKAIALCSANLEEWNSKRLSIRKFLRAGRGPSNSYRLWTNINGARCLGSAASCVHWEWFPNGDWIIKIRNWLLAPFGRQCWCHRLHLGYDQSWCSSLYWLYPLFDDRAKLHGSTRQYFCHSQALRLRWTVHSFRLRFGFESIWPLRWFREQGGLWGLCLDELWWEKCWNDGRLPQVWTICESCTKRGAKKLADKKNYRCWPLCMLRYGTYRSAGHLDFNSLGRRSCSTSVHFSGSGIPVEFRFGRWDRS